MTQENRPLWQMYRGKFFWEDSSLYWGKRFQFPRIPIAPIDIGHGLDIIMEELSPSSPYSLEVEVRGKRATVRYKKWSTATHSDLPIWWTRFFTAFGIGAVMTSSGSFDKKYLLVDLKSRAYKYACDLLMPEHSYRPMFRVLVKAPPSPTWTAIKGWCSRFILRRAPPVEKAEEDPLMDMARYFQVPLVYMKLRFEDLYTVGRRRT